MDQSCLSSLLPRRTRAPSELKSRHDAQDAWEDDAGGLGSEKVPPHLHLIVPDYHNSFDGQRYLSNQVNISVRGSSPELVQGHAVGGRRFFHRGSLSRRQKSHPSLLSSELRVSGEAALSGLGTDTHKKLDHKGCMTLRPPRWLQSCAAATFWPRRRSRTIPETCYESSCEPDRVISPRPGTGMKPPRIPDDMMSGAAARAAAATQNEILESVRNLRLLEPKIPRDSESGIGIEMRDRWEEDEDEVVRKDFVHILPEELTVQILSVLDATSLINVELVSRRWHRSARSNHIWRRIFINEFNFCSPMDTEKPVQFQIGGLGLGKAGVDQDWKSMWRARKALHQRWHNGYAAAIYLDGHSDSVYCVQFDEHKILTGSRDRTIRIWDAHTYECVKILGVPIPNYGAPVPPLPVESNGRGQRPFKRVFSPQAPPEPSATSTSFYHQGSILCLQYSDEILVTGSSDCTCIVWDIKAGYSPVRQLRHHTAGVLDVCFDTKHIVSCSKDTTICLWDQETGDFLRKLSGHRGPVNAVQMRGTLVVSASGDGIAKLWNLASGLCIKEFPSKDRGMACVEFSPDSRTILAGGNDQVIYQFDTNTGELVRELNGHKGLVRSLHLDSANDRVVSGSYDSSVKAFDLCTGDNIVDFMGWTTSWILSAKADYRRIIATSQDSRIVIMDFGFELPGVELLAG